MPKAAYDLPTPEEALTFLVKTPKAILISAQEQCENSCTLKVYRDHDLIASTEFMKGQPSYLKLPPEKVQEGIYEWTFESETSAFKSNFEIKKFSEDEFMKALSANKPIEILD